MIHCDMDVLHARVPAYGFAHIFAACSAFRPVANDPQGYAAAHEVESERDTRGTQGRQVNYTAE